MSEAMSELPPIGEPVVPCEKCGWHIDDEILASAPDCPHGWVSLEEMPLADIKSLFAGADSELSLSPTIDGEGDDK